MVWEGRSCEASPYPDLHANGIRDGIGPPFGYRQPSGMVVQRSLTGWWAGSAKGSVDPSFVFLTSFLRLSELPHPKAGRDWGVYLGVLCGGVTG